MYKPKYSLTLGNLYGATVRLDWSLFLLFAILAIWHAHLIIIYGIAFVSVFLHEMGHVFACRLQKVPCRNVTLNILGGVASTELPIEKTIDRKYWSKLELFVALGGPAVNLLLILPLYVVGLQTAALLNVMILLFNLVPILPLDGGRVFRALLTRWWGFGVATQAVGWVGRLLLCITLALTWGVYSSISFLAIILIVFNEVQTFLDLERHDELTGGGG